MGWLGRSYPLNVKTTTTMLFVIELSIAVQRQLITELEFTESDVDSKGILIEVRNGFSDYQPFALKNFLEHCTGHKATVVRMVIASDKQTVIAVFDTDIGKFYRLRMVSGLCTKIRGSKVIILAWRYVFNE